MRTRPTTTDYMLAALAPALIIGMINCLVFFLITVVYQGDFSVRLMYLLGLYTFGSVLIAHIAIEQSRALASTYTAVIGLATLFVVMRFVEFRGSLAVLSVPIVFGFLVLIGFLADRITFDCTLIDEQEDSSGEGLLQSLGLPRSSIRSKKRKRHNPGVWVLYFSLLAFPLFGLGQLAIPATATDARAWSFWFLFGYLLFSLTLLLATSFLGLRRYLRQCQVTMPASMASVWMLGGFLGILGLLVVCMILPLPGRNAGLIGLPTFLTSPSNLQASRFGWGNEGRPSDEQGNAPTDDPKMDPNGKAKKDGELGDEDPNASKSSKGDSKETSSNRNEDSKESNSKPNSSQEQPAREDKSSQSKSESESASRNDGGDEKSDQGKKQDTKPKGDRSNSSEEAKGDQAKGSSNNSTTKPSSSSSPTWTLPEWGGLTNVIKWLTIAVLALVLLVYLVLHGSEFLAMLRSLWGRAEQTEGEPGEHDIVPTKGIPLPTFSSFADPFSGNRSGMDGAQVVRHTFDAVEAWGRDRSLVRSAEETPDEFLGRLGRRFKDQSELFASLSNQYNGLAYSRGKDVTLDPSPLKRLWSFLKS